MFEWVEDIKDWFKERGDDITGLDKNFQDLINNKLIPNKYYAIYESLLKNNNKAEEMQEKSHDNYQVAEENRKRYKNELEQKEMMFKDKYGGLVNKLKYNVPLPGLRFSANGKDYHRLKREIKIATRNHKFWARMSDEKYNIFTASEENRKNRRRALIEYKRMAVRKAKQYDEVFKFVKEYNLLRVYDENKLKDTFGAELTSRIVTLKDDIRANWLDIEKSNYATSFNFKEAAKVLKKLRMNQQITEEDKKIMESIIPQKQPNKQKSKMNLKPPVDYAKYNLDRRAVEVISYKLNLSPEDFLAILNMAHQKSKANPQVAGKLEQNMQEAADQLKILKKDTANDKKIEEFAAHGAEFFGEMVQKNITIGEYGKFIKTYNKAKEKIDQYARNSTQTQTQSRT